MKVSQEKIKLSSNSSLNIKKMSVSIKKKKGKLEKEVGLLELKWEYLLYMSF